jgi:hypothetical protein
MATAQSAPPSLRTTLGPLAHAGDEKKNGHDNPPPDDGAGDDAGADV